MTLSPERLEVIENFPMPQLRRHRNIRIYLPIDYHETDRHYPVLYMHDAQNLFQAELSFCGISWQCGETLDSLQHDHTTEGIILVGIDNSPLVNGVGRMDEYSPWSSQFPEVLKHWETDKKGRGGEGDLYLSWLVENLKPYIDSHYRTQPDRDKTILAGSSMGGLISLYGGMKYSEVFSGVGVFSPAFWFAGRPMSKFIENVKLSNSLTVYMDIGTHETSDEQIGCFPEVYLKGAQTIQKQLEGKSMVVSLPLLIDESGIHNESAWARRFPDMVRKLL